MKTLLLNGRPTTEDHILHNDLILTTNKDIIDHNNVEKPLSDYNRVTFKLIFKLYALRHSRKQV